MGSKEKIRQYLDYKNITIYKFQKITGFSDGILKSGKDFGVDKLKQIRDKCPDLNMNWLIYDEGEMILSNDYSVASRSEQSNLSTSIEDVIADKVIQKLQPFFIKRGLEIESLKCEVDLVKTGITLLNEKD